MNAQLHYSAREFTTIQHVTESYFHFQGPVLTAVTSSHVQKEKCNVTTLVLPTNEIQSLRRRVITKTI